MKKLIIFVLTLISMNISVTSYAQPKAIDINMIKYTVDKNEKVTRKECYQAYYNTQGKLIIRPTVGSILILTKITDKEWKDESRKIWDRIERDGVVYFFVSKKLAYYYESTNTTNNTSNTK